MKQTMAGLGLAEVLFSPGLLRAQDTSHKLTAMDEFQLQVATDPQISPDARNLTKSAGVPATTSQKCSM